MFKERNLVLQTLDEVKSMVTSFRVLDAPLDEVDEMVELTEKILGFLKLAQSRRAKTGDKASQDLLIETQQAMRSRPRYQYGEILRTFRRIRKPLSAARLHWGYLRNIPIETLQMRCDELASGGKLEKVVDKRSPAGRFLLPVSQ